jgi:type IV pilus assembly protein PilO
MKKPELSLNALEPLFEKIEKLPKLYRILISCGLFLIFIGAFVWLLYLPKYSQIDSLEKDLAKLSDELGKAKRNAKDLKKFQQKIKEAEDQFKTVMRSLPEKEEIPSLLTSISDSGIKSGLEFVLFQPRPEVSKDFYAELPVAIRVSGKYHNIALFFDRVARLPRVVNLRDITMKPEKSGESISTSCVAVTYKFVESGAKASSKKKGKKKKK